MGAVQKSRATALREIADEIEKKGDGNLSEDIVTMVDDLLDLIRHDEAVRDWRAREAAGEKTIPSAEVRKMLGF